MEFLRIVGGRAIKEKIRNYIIGKLFGIQDVLEGIQ
jgi:hypothetical protein